MFLQKETGFLTLVQDVRSKLFFLHYCRHRLAQLSIPFKATHYSLLTTHYSLLTTLRIPLSPDLLKRTATTPYSLRLSPLPLHLK